MDKAYYTELIKKHSETMEKFRTKSELGGFLAKTALTYSMQDLQIISGHIKHTADILPNPYRSAFTPYLDKWFFGRHHTLLLMYHNGEFLTNSDKKSKLGDIKDLDTYRRFCKAAYLGSIDTEFDDQNAFDDYYNGDKKAYYKFFYYLINAFGMYVLDEPGHPEGTPFPGGMRVKKSGGEFLCPIRDKEEEIINSICNFCPAKQDPDNL